ncbi:MAG: DUF4080 domain-containing protein [Bacilli bacterium]
MKIIVSTINSKYIHINNSVYIIQMYLNNQSKVVTYNIKQGVEYILDDLVQKDASFYFFSIYIWNIELYKQIIPRLKILLPNCKVIAGGPEVSYDSAYLLEIVDYIFRGEVNESVNEIIIGEITSKHIVYNNYKKSICNYNNFVHNITYFDKITMDKNQIVYVETSKGCPYKCSYCMSSLENKVVNLELENVYHLIDLVINSDVKVVKFLDRTFNIDEKRCFKIMEYIKNKHKDFQSFQFEIAPEIITKKFLEYLKSIDITCFRFEVGIQSVNDLTINAVDRYHSFENYKDILADLCDKTNIITHFDLIAGLPYETYDKFVDSFNQTFRLLPDEYQLGILKVLNGTKMKSQVDEHGIIYDNVAPYQFSYNNYLSKHDCDTINEVENIVDRFYNKGNFKNTFRIIVNEYLDVFNVLLDFSNYIKKNNYRLINYQLYDIYKMFYLFLGKYNSKICDYVILDYLNKINCKPKRFYPKLDRKELNNLFLRLVDGTKSINYLYKYVIVEKLYLNGYTYVIKDLYNGEIKFVAYFENRLVY